MINEIISAILQILVFSLIPFLVFVIRNRRTKGFLHYIGLKKSNTKANLTALLVSLLMSLPIIAIAYFNEGFYQIMTNPETLTGKVRAMGFGAEAIGVILVVAIFKTALSEEILFRGFVAKRLISVTGFQTGNIIHAVLFGAIHTLLFLTISDNVGFLILIFVFPTLGAYFMTYINEKMADGSIIPGWIAHALANILSYSIIGFTG